MWALSFPPIPTNTNAICTTATNHRIRCCVCNHAQVVGPYVLSPNAPNGVVDYKKRLEPNMDWKKSEHTRTHTGKLQDVQILPLPRFIQNLIECSLVNALRTFMSSRAVCSNLALLSPLQWPVCNQGTFCQTMSNSTHTPRGTEFMSNSRHLPPPAPLPPPILNACSTCHATPCPQPLYSRSARDSPPTTYQCSFFFNFFLLSDKMDYVQHDKVLGGGGRDKQL